MMGDISFEMLYQKSLKIKPLTDNIETNSFHIRNLKPEEQIDYLKQLGNIKVDKEDSKINIYSRKINNIDYGVYMIKVPIIKESFKDGIKVYADYLYRTCMIAIKEDEQGMWSLDNILLYQDNDFDKVETQYKKLYKILSEKNEYELLKIIDSAIDDEISKNK